MKLNYRDKVILIVLLVILVWAIGIMYFIKPKFDDLDAANKELDAAVLDLEKKQAEIEADKDLPQRVEDAFARVTNLSDTFYDKMKSDAVSTLIDTLLDKDNIENDSMSISAYSSATLDFINATPMEATTDVDKLAQASQQLGESEIIDATEVVEGAEGPVVVPAYTVTFGFECKLDDLKVFFDHLIEPESDKIEDIAIHKSLVVTDCVIDDVTAEDTVTGNMTMVLMMMPRMENPIDKDNAANAAASAES